MINLRKICQRRLWCVFGCGGNRDKGKRVEMGQVAERFSDQIVLTNDNPRNEDPDQIIDDIASGLLCRWAVEIQQNRAAAIAYAIQNGRSGDVILIAGKGHENYQIIGNQKLNFSDVEQVQMQLKMLELA